MQKKQSRDLYDKKKITNNFCTLDNQGQKFEHMKNSYNLCCLPQKILNGHAKLHLGIFIKATQ